MPRRAACVAAASLAFAPAANAARPGLAEVHAPTGAVLAQAHPGAYAYPADGSVLRIGSASATAAGVDLRDVRLFRGLVYADRVYVPARGFEGARVDGLVVAGRDAPGTPNTVLPLGGASYLVALQEAVAPGQSGASAGLVGLRVYVADPSLGVPAGTQLLVGVARAAGAPPTARSRPSSRYSLLGVAPTPFPSSFAGTPEPPALTPLPPGGSTGARAVAIAERYLGIPYVWAGADPVTGFDCSGLVMFVYRQLGIPLNHFSGDQWYEGTRVPTGELAPGDLVFFHMGPNGPGHEGMYIGNNRFIHAPHTGDVVKISSLLDPSYALGYVGAVRPY